VKAESEARSEILVIQPQAISGLSKRARYGALPLPLSKLAKEHRRVWSYWPAWAGSGESRRHRYRASTPKSRVPWK